MSALSRLREAFDHYRVRSALPREGQDGAWLRPVAEAVMAKPNAGAQRAASRIEPMRAKMAAQSGDIVVFYSAKPGSFTADAQDRPEPGEEIRISHAKAANTGVSKPWGQALFSLVQERRPKSVLELGACCGFSACYMAAASADAKITTIEASAALAGFAREHLGELTDKAVVMNALFDDALDELLAKDPLPEFDLVYIDGHHEKEATLHYYRRVKPMLSPGAVVLFDDIRWSQDMHDCWSEIKSLPDFSLAADLGKLGLVVVGDNQPRTEVDLSGLAGKKINVPWGWGRTAGPAEA
jgi:predicted O-methyltransferase YrrM